MLQKKFYPKQLATLRQKENRPPTLISIVSRKIILTVKRRANWCLSIQISVYNHALLLVTQRAHTKKDMHPKNTYLEGSTTRYKGMK